MDKLMSALIGAVVVCTMFIFVFGIIWVLMKAGGF